MEEVPARLTIEIVLQRSSFVYVWCLLSVHLLFLDLLLEAMMVSLFGLSVGCSFA